MELLRAGEALLPFLAPSAHLLRSSRKSSTTTTKLITQHCKTQNVYQSSTSFRSLSRPFSISHCTRQAESQEPKDGRDASTSSSTDPMSSLFAAALDLNKGNSAASSAGGTQQNDSSAGSAGKLDGFQPPAGNTIDELLSAIGQRTPFSPSRGGTFGGKHGSRRMPDFLAGGSDGLVERSPPPPLEPPPRKLGPAIGRTVEVSSQRNMDVARAFRMLDVRCARNRVRQDFAKQRFHERPGLKRKRLKMERWRRRFKAQFSATVQMVQRMRKQGW